MALPNPGMDAVPFTPLTAEFLDDMIENIESLSDGTGFETGAITTNTLADNAITARKMSTDSILLGLVESSSDFTTASGTFVLRTGLSATVTVPSGGRKVKVTVGFRTIYMAGGTNGTATVSVWDGTVGSGTQLGERTYRLQDAAFEVSPTPMFFQSPSAGSKTYNVGVKTTAGTIGFQGTAAGKAFILVEAL